VTEDEQKMFTKLLFDHKHLWTAFQATRHLREFPDDDPTEVHVRFSAAADEVYRPLTDALLEEQPIQDILEKVETVLLASNIAQAEGRLY
jgi:hypothetical protein